MTLRLNVPIVLVAALLAVFVSRAPAAIGPENVLVLYNEASTEGTQVASYYAQVHPGVQVLGLTNVGFDEEMSTDDYLDVIRPQILPALTPSIDVIVTTKGLPLRIVNSHANPNPIYPWSKFSSLESELTRVDSIDTWQEMGDQDWLYGGSYHLARNPYYRDGVAFDHGTFGIRLSCRLDGFTVADVTASVRRAQQAFVDRIDSADLFHFVVDNDPNAPGATINGMPALANVLSAAQVPYTYDNTDAFITGAPRPVQGYVSYGVHGGGACSPNSYLVDEVDGLTFELANGAVFHTWESYNAYTFIEGGNRAGQGLVAEWIARGGTAGTGHVQEPGANPLSVANEDVMFAMLLEGYTWVEAAWCATRQLSFVNTVVGDPLMIVSVPADANKDGLVGLSDLILLDDNWGTQGEPGGALYRLGDFNADGLVGWADLIVLGTRWGTTADWYTGDGAGPLPDILSGLIPEPSTLLSTLIGGLLGLLVYGGRRRHRSVSAA